MENWNIKTNDRVQPSKGRDGLTALAGLAGWMSCHSDYGIDELTESCAGGMALDDEGNIDWEAVAAIEGAKVAAEAIAAAPNTAADGVKDP